MGYKKGKGGEKIPIGSALSKEDQPTVALRKKIFDKEEEARKKAEARNNKSIETNPLSDKQPVKTRIVYNSKVDSDDFIETSSNSDTADKGGLATGALVVIEGKGKGQVVIMGVGMNSVGRNKSQRVCLDFGDDSISRENHFRLIYENRKGKYFIAPGDAVNLVYLNKQEMVASPMPLKHGDLIQVGDTSLRFIPFCDDVFDWDK